MKVISKKDAKVAGLKYYYTGIECKRGHLSERLVSSGNCVECHRERHREWYKDAEVRAKKAEYNRERYKDAEVRAKRCEYERERRKDPEVRAKKAEYKREYRNVPTNKAKRCEWEREWRKTEYGSLRTMVNSTLKRIEKTKSTTTAIDLLGYTPEQFHAHITSQLVNGLSWEDRSMWHIDHIIPVKQFYDNGFGSDEYIPMICALDNLRVLPASDNISKHDTPVDDSVFWEYIGNFGYSK